MLLEINFPRSCHFQATKPSTFLRARRSVLLSSQSLLNQRIALLAGSPCLHNTACRRARMRRLYLISPYMAWLCWATKKKHTARYALRSDELNEVDDIWIQWVNIKCFINVENKKLGNRSGEKKKYFSDVGQCYAKRFLLTLYFVSDMR